MNDVYLNPRTPVAALSPFDLWPSFEIVSVPESHVRLRGVSSGDVVTENDAVDAILSRMDVGDLPEPQQERLLQVIGKYRATFSESEDDLEFCDLVKHKIVTTEERPIKSSTESCDCVSTTGFLMPRQARMHTHYNESTRRLMF